MKILLCPVAFFLFQCAVCAGLEWEKTQLEFHPSATDAEVKGDFNFTNTGKEPVTIDAVEPGCGCTTAVLDKKTYAPGEKGRVTATFNIGQRTGEQHKIIRVKIHDAPEPAVLTMITHIPELMKMSPQFVWWKAGDEPRPQTIELTVMPDAHLRVTRVLSTDPKIKPTLETVEEGKSYKVVVTPEQTATPLMAVLTIDSTLAPDHQKLFTAFAQVKPPEIPARVLPPVKKAEAAPAPVAK
jgi:uncharacterized protein DUF1573